VGEAFEPLLNPQIKDYKLSSLCGRSQAEKSFACTNEGVFIGKGETNPCGCLTSLFTIWFPWPFNFTWLLIWKVDLLDFHDTLHWLIVWPIVEMWMPWLMTRLDMTVLAHSFYCWCACQVVVLMGDGCPRGVSQLKLCMASCMESLMVIGFSWCCIRTLLLICMLACLTSLSIHKRCMLIHLSFHKHIFACYSVCPSPNTSLHDRLFTITSLYMHHFFILSWTCPLACTPLVHPICHRVVFVSVHVFVVTHDNTTSNP